MKPEEDRRSEQEARAEIAAHPTSTSRHASALARYLAATAYGEESPDEHEEPDTPEPPHPAP